MPTARPDTTPLGRLDDAGLHGIVGYQLAQATLVTDAVFDAAIRTPLGLRPFEFTLLTLLDHNPDVTPRRLAAALAVTPPNITAWIDKLEARGLVRRERSETDRRALHLRLTPRGATLSRKAVAAVSAAEAAALGDALSAAEHAMLAELLHKVARRRARSAG